MVINDYFPRWMILEDYQYWRDGGVNLYADVLVWLTTIVTLAEQNRITIYAA